MTRKLILFSALLITGRVHAQLNILSSSQGVNGSGFATIHQYASSNFAYTATSGNVGGSIWLIDPTPDQNGLSNQDAYCQSTASFSVTQTESQISCNSSLLLEDRGPLDSSGGYGSGSATSAYQVSFTVSYPQSYQISMNTFSPFSIGDLALDFHVNLSSANQGLIVGWNSGALNPPFYQPISGVLVPGDIYTLQDSSDVDGTSDDPVGASVGIDLGVTLTVVPEPSCAWLLVIGVAGVAAIRLFQQHGCRIHKNPEAV